MKDELTNRVENELARLDQQRQEQEQSRYVTIGKERALNLDELHGLGDDCQNFLFVPSLWRAILSCFNPYRAVHLAFIFGKQQLDWAIKVLLPEYAEKECWEEAVKHDWVGLLASMQEDNVVCPEFHRLVQLAVDLNHVNLIRFFIGVGLRFNNVNERPISVQHVCPKLDQAARRNHLEVVRYFVDRHPEYKERMFKRPLALVHRLMAHNRLEMLRLMVPRIMTIKGKQGLAGLKAAARKGHLEILEHALSHLDPDTFPSSEVPSSLLVMAAQHGRLEVLKLLQRHHHDEIPMAAYSAAFVQGHADLLRACCPHYRPTKNDMLEACGAGHHDVMVTLPDDVEVPDECFDRLVKSGTKEFLLLMWLVERKPHYRFEPRLLSLVMQQKQKNQEMFVALLRIGKNKFKKLPKGIELELVEHRMRQALRIAHLFDFQVYTEAAFFLSARRCFTDILQDILDSGVVDLTAEDIQRAKRDIDLGIEKLELQVQSKAIIDAYWRQKSKTEEEDEDQDPEDPPEPESKRQKIQ